MKISDKRKKLIFATKSCIWALLLYFVTIAAIHISETQSTGDGNDNVIVVASTINNKPEAINISIDSLRKSISYADKVITMISTQLLPVLHTSQ